MLKVFPMFPSKPIDWVTRRPLIEKVTYPTSNGHTIGDIYRPSGEGRHPAIVVCLGVVPFGTDHPQVPRLGVALARSGFVALLFWSQSMRDQRLEADDIDNIALAYEWLIERPYVNSGRSGLLGTCVGGSFTLMAAANSRIREQVSFVTTYAPYSSVWTFLQDIASDSTVRENIRDPWQVDQLTRKVFVRSLTAKLETDEAELLREALLSEEGLPEIETLSENGRSIYPLLTHPDADEAKRILGQLPSALQDRLSGMSPINYINDIHAPLIILIHDRGDSVVPVGESRRLCARFEARAGVHYTELQFQHLDPARLPLYRLIREMVKFYSAIYPLFYY